MAIIGITITKETAFRDSVQPFSNMYFYNNGAGGTPTGTEANNLIDELTAFEKTVHSNAVTFTFGRCWLQALTELGSTMIVQKPLSGAGALGVDTALDKERAFLFRRRAGNDSRGNPVFLRKWYHSCGAFPGSGGLDTGLYSNATGFSSAERTAMANAMDTISNIGGSPGPFDICARSGRDPDPASGWTAHPYLEHHQLGDQWRGA